MTTLQKQANNNRCKNFKNYLLARMQCKGKFIWCKRIPLVKNFGNLSCPCKCPHMALWVHFPYTTPCHWLNQGTSSSFSSNSQKMCHQRTVVYPQHGWTLFEPYFAPKVVKPWIKRWPWLWCHLKSPKWLEGGWIAYKIFYKYTRARG